MRFGFVDAFEKRVLKRKRFAERSFVAVEVKQSGCQSMDAVQDT